jgi:N-acetylmuramoyl-L-alanine amidase
VGKTFPVENGFLQQVRIGQYRATVTRVVLDVAKIDEYSVFTLPNPFRLVVDINGPPVPEAKAEVAAKPEPSPQKAAESPEVAKPTTVAEVRKRAAPPASEPEVKTKKETPPQHAVTTPGEKPQTASRPSGEATKKEAATATGPEVAAAKRESSADTKPGPARAPSPTVSGSRTLTRALGLKIARIVIDPGHGGHDTGTIGPTGLREKDLVLDVGKRLKVLLEEKTGAEVVMTRSDDTFIPLEERTAIANEKSADLFISIHANASRDRRARGIETYYLNFTSDPEALEVAGRENATSQESVHQLQDLIKKIALTEKITESQDFATKVQREVHSKLRQLTGEQKDRGIKKAPFVVLIGANMPSVLAEISFLTNPKDEKLLKKSDHRDHIAEALYKGISCYVENLGGVKVTEQASNSPGTKTNLKTGSAGASNF